MAVLKGVASMSLQHPISCCLFCAHSANMICRSTAFLDTELVIGVHVHPTVADLAAVVLAGMLSIPFDRVI